MLVSGGCLCYFCRLPSPSAYFVPLLSPGQFTCPNTSSRSHSHTPSPLASPAVSPSLLRYCRRPWRRIRWRRPLLRVLMMMMMMISWLLLLLLLLLLSRLVLWVMLLLWLWLWLLLAWLRLRLRLQHCRWERLVHRRWRCSRVGGVVIDRRWNGACGSGCGDGGGGDWRDGQAGVAVPVRADGVDGQGDCVEHAVRGRREHGYTQYHTCAWAGRVGCMDGCMDGCREGGNEKNRR